MARRLRDIGDARIEIEDALAVPAGVAPVSATAGGIPLGRRPVLGWGLTCLVPGEFRICRHFHPRVQDELSQSFDFPIFKRCNQIETGLFKGERV